MKILAIDPGNVQSAFVRWDTELDTFLPGVKHGLIDNSLFEEEFSNITAGVDAVICEMVQSYGMGVGRTIFETCLFVGAVKNMSKNLCVDFSMYGRPTIKGQVGGRTDSEIRASLRLRYGDARKGEKLEGVKRDIWAALALACAVTENKNLKKW